MSIQLGSVRENSGLQYNPKAAQAAVAVSGTQDTVPNPRASGVKAELSIASAAQAAADVKEAEVSKPSAKQVQQSLDDINKVLTGFSISVRFQVDPDFNELIVKVVDVDSGKLIRQFPSEDMVKMSKAMDNLKGLLFAKSV